MPTPPSTTADLVTDDGIRLRVLCWDPSSPADGLPPVVLQHGFAATTQLNWGAPGIVDALLAAGRQVVGIDARGHGGSDAPHDPAAYGEPRMARDLWAVVDDAGWAQVDLVGYSMGAIIGLLAAAARPQAVRRLVVGGVGSGVIEQGGLDRRTVDPDRMAAALLAEDPATITDPQALGFRRFAEATGADRAALAAQSRRAHRDGVDTAAITMPVLVVAGDADTLAKRPQVLVDALPDARLQILSGDHLAAVGDPAMARAIVDFLGQRQPRAADVTTSTWGSAGPGCR